MSPARPGRISLLLALLLAGLVLFPALGQTTQEPTPDELRADFLAARRALHLGRTDDYRARAVKLRDYILYPYLRYDYLRRRLDEVDPQTVARFVRRYADTPLAGRLHRAWLYHLARSHRWSRYLADYDDDWGTELRCHYLNARWREGKTDGLWDEVRKLWRVGHSQPKACDPLFAAWRDQGRMTRDDVLDRIGLAMGQGRMGLVGYLAKFLGKSDREWVGRWQRMHRDPEAELARLVPGQAREWSARLFAYGIHRLARSDAVEADALWREQRDLYPLSKRQRLRIERVIALHLAFQRAPRASARLGALPAAATDRAVRTWRVRAALWRQSWPAVLKAIAGLSDAERGHNEWIYWQARALEGTGREGKARALFAKLADARGFYGFLSAQRLGSAPAVETSPLAVSPQAQAAMARQPAIARARELYLVKLYTDARREWRDATARMGPEELRTAAKLADSWGWHNQAILTLGKTDSLDDLELRFPTPYEAEVLAAADDRALDAAFVYAVMRQESAFNARARSAAGALGLMQLMPATAKRIARKLNHPVPGTYDILAVNKNITMGTEHLRHLLDRFQGNLLYTAAAYNAGSHRVKRWRPRTLTVPGDVWIATLPYGETRRYIQRILAYTVIYEWRLGREPAPITRYIQSLVPTAPDTMAEKPTAEGQSAG
jgi:soluble lytic murein transglycosylase